MELDQTGGMGVTAVFAITYVRYSIRTHLLNSPKHVLSKSHGNLSVRFCYMLCAKLIF